MKKLHSLTLYALMAPAMTLCMGSALAQEQRSMPEPTQQQQAPTEQEKGPHVVKVPTAERSAAEIEAEKRAQQERADQDARQAQGASQAPVMGERTTQGATPATRATPANYLTSKPANSFRVDQLIGSDLKSRTGTETIGSISDLVIDEDGQILAVIVEVGGFLGMGQKNVAIPWDSVERTRNEKGDGHELHISASKEALTNAPEYKGEAKKY